MPGYYTYLISSLPTLHFGTRPPLSFEDFIQMCQGLISDRDIEILKAASITGEAIPRRQGLAEDIQPSFPPRADRPLAEKKWYAFEIALRNELVNIRASRKHLDPHKYLRGDGYVDPYITHIAMSAHRNPSILEAEIALDRARWRMLEELSIGHYFDIDFLIVYALKLLILERWVRINTADKSQALEEVLQ